MKKKMFLGIVISLFVIGLVIATSVTFLGNRVDADVVVSSPRVEEAAREAERAVDWLRPRVARSWPKVDLVGPAPSPIEKLHGRWRWHFLLRSISPKELGATLLALRDGFQAKGTDIRLIIDRDPVALL